MVTNNYKIHYEEDVGRMPSANVSTADEPLLTSMSPGARGRSCGIAGGRVSPGANFK